MVLAVELALVTQGGHAVALTQQAAKAPAEEKQAPEGPREAADIPSAKVAAKLSGNRVRRCPSAPRPPRPGSTRTALSPPNCPPDRSVSSTTAPGPTSTSNCASRRRSRRPTRTASLAGRPAGRRVAQAAQAPARDLVTLGEGDERITLQWKGGLPKPTLKGARAEYADAVPGADVVVEATRTGFEQYVEIKRRPRPPTTRTRCR
ncbi:RHS repeat-associated core domain-containing protein [Streptomyces californicus]